MDKTIEDLQKATKELASMVKKMASMSREEKRRVKKEFDKLKTNLAGLLQNYESLSTSIIEKGDSKLLVVVGEAMGLYLKAQRISSSQLRNIFGYAKRIDEEVKNTSEPLSGDVVRKLLLLSPKLAYVAGRMMKKNNSESDESRALKMLRDVFDRCVEKIGTDAAKFKRFMDLFEVILSYHKFYGGAK